jgi:hypothetical protein
MSNTLKRIVAEAKRIQKAHPHMEWKSAIKDASKHIKEGAKTIIKKSQKTIGKTYGNPPFTYKGYNVDVTFNGYYMTKSKDVGYLKADTKQGIKDLINKEIGKFKKLGLGYADDRYETLRKQTPVIKKYLKKGLPRKKAIKKATSIHGIEWNTQPFTLISISKDLRKYGKKVAKANAFSIYKATYNQNDSKSIDLANNLKKMHNWIPSVENGVIFYRNDIEPYSYNHGEDAGINIDFIVPTDKKIDSHKRKAITIAKKLLNAFKYENM